MSPLKSLVSEIATDIPILVIDPEFAVFVIKFGFLYFGVSGSFGFCILSSSTSWFVSLWLLYYFGL